MTQAILNHKMREMLKFCEVRFNSGPSERDGVELLSKGDGYISLLSQLDTRNVEGFQVVNREPRHCGS